VLQVLQCVAECCSVLQCVAVCCRVLQCVAVCCSVLQVLQFVVVCGGTFHTHLNDSLRSVLEVENMAPSIEKVLQCVAVCCSVLQCVVACCSLLQLVWRRLMNTAENSFKNVTEVENRGPSMCIAVRCSVAACCSALKSVSHTHTCMTAFGVSLR